MIEKPFRELFFQKDIESCNTLIENQSTTVDLVNIISDLIYVSCSIDFTSASTSTVHPIAVVNSIKNFISDNRNNPSKLLLKYALNYLNRFEKRNDEDLFKDITRAGFGETVFAGDLEDLCQEGKWDEAKLYTGKLFLVSDQSRAVMDTLVELALQDPKRNITFCFHLLRAYQFQELKEDNWAFINCLFNHLSGYRLPRPHKNKKINIEKFREQMIYKLNPVFYASVLRIWDGDYVRIRGYRRELNHLIFSKMRKIKQKDFDKYNDFPIKNFNFIEEAEKLILRNGENIASELVILESLRYLDRACEIKHKPYINFLLLKLLGK